MAILGRPIALPWLTQQAANRAGTGAQLASGDVPAPALFLSSTNAGDNGIPRTKATSIGGGGAIVQTLDDYPKYQQVLVGPDTAADTLIPESLQAYILPLKISANSAQITYDPVHQDALRPYLLTCKTALRSAGFKLLEDVFVDTAILVKIRHSAQANQSAFRGHAATSDAVVRFKNWIVAANAAGATDVHIRVVGSGRGEVLARIDGELEPLPETKMGVTDAEAMDTIRAAFESLADRHSNSTATFSEKTNMSCMIDKSLGIANLRLRFNSQRGLDGPKAVIRLLHEDTTKPAMSFAQMGFEASQVEIFERAQRTESGIVLLCGVTGSGKTTAAKTFLETHPKNDGNDHSHGQPYPKASIYQVADPIEYRLRGTHQVYVQRSLMTLNEAGKKDPYSEVMESLMRMDPDVIDVGEIRDLLSARAAMNVAKCGHLGMGTLHVDSIAGIPNRLTDPNLGLSREELTAGNALSLLVYQALVPVLCPHCKLDASNASLQLTSFGQDKALAHLNWLLQVLNRQFHIPALGLRFKNMDGCSHCSGRGTKGLTMVAEMMMPDDQWLDDTRTGNDRLAWRNHRQRHSDKDLASPNMHGKTVLEHALFKSVLGTIDPRNIERFARSIDTYEVLK